MHTIIKEYSVEDRNKHIGYQCTGCTRGWALDEKAKADQHAKDSNR